MERVRRVELPTLCLASMASEKGLANANLANHSEALDDHIFSQLTEKPRSRNVPNRSFQTLKKCNVARRQIN